MSVISELLLKIVEETVKFNLLPIEAKRKEWRECKFIAPSFPLGDGRQLFTSMRAIEHFNSLTKQIYQDEIVRESYSKNNFRQKAQTSVGKLFGYMDSMSEKEVEQNFREILREELKLTLVDHARIIPCDIFSSATDQTFDIGPISFAPRNIWLKTKHGLTDWGNLVQQVWDGRLSQDQLKNLAGDEGPSAISAHEADAVVTTFGGRLWAASIDLKEYDHQLSQTRAEGITDIALGVLGLVLDPSDAASLNYAGDERPTEHNRLGITPSGKVISGWSASLPGIYSHEEAIKRFFSNELTVRLLKAAGVVLNKYVNKDIGSKARLIERWANAIDWYRQAIKDNIDYMSLVKYGCALDIISGANGNLRKMTIFCEELFYIDGQKNSESKRKAIKKIIYDIYKEGRSQLAHGSKSGLLKDMSEERLQANHFTRELLINVTLPLAELIINDSGILKLKKEETRAFSAYVLKRYQQSKS